MSDINPSQSKKEVSGNNAEANIHDATGKVLAIVAFGISIFALGISIPVWFIARDTRGDLLQEIQRSESRMLADNREKTTAYTLLDNHVKELENRLKVAEAINERRR